MQYYKLIIFGKAGEQYGKMFFYTDDSFSSFSYLLQIVTSSSSSSSTCSRLHLR